MTHETSTLTPIAAEFLDAFVAARKKSNALYERMVGADVADPEWQAVRNADAAALIAMRAAACLVCYQLAAETGREL